MKVIKNDAVKQLLVNFLDWYHKEGAENPMRFETDNDDVVAMYIESHLKPEEQLLDEYPTIESYKALYEQKNKQTK